MYTTASDNETVKPIRSAPDVRSMPSSPDAAYKTYFYLLEVLLL